MFDKPVIFDDDGGEENSISEGRNNNLNIEQWAESIANGCGVSGTLGKLHLYHTGDGTIDQGSAPLVCHNPDEGPIDCRAWNGLADGFPTMICPGSGCVNSRIDYCENKTSPDVACKWNSCSQSQ